MFYKKQVLITTLILLCGLPCSVQGSRDIPTKLGLLPAEVLSPWVIYKEKVTAISKKVGDLVTHLSELMEKPRRESEHLIQLIREIVQFITDENAAAQKAFASGSENLKDIFSALDKRLALYYQELAAALGRTASSSGYSYSKDRL